MIPFVLLEVSPQVVYPLGEKGDLNRCAPPVAFVQLVFPDECLPFCRIHVRHGTVCYLRKSPLLQGKP